MRRLRTFFSVGGLLIGITLGLGAQCKTTPSSTTGVIKAWTSCPTSTCKFPITVNIVPKNGGVAVTGNLTMPFTAEPACDAAGTVSIEEAPATYLVAASGFSSDGTKTETWADQEVVVTAGNCVPVHFSAQSPSALLDSPGLLDWLRPGGTEPRPTSTKLVAERLTPVGMRVTRLK